MRVGIDLGTTFSCIAYVDANGHPTVIPNELGALTTPSIIAFEGTHAKVGERAAEMKARAPTQVYEFIKRDIGKPVDERAATASVGEAVTIDAAPYEIGGFKYGAAGMSGIILRKLKRDAWRFFIARGLLPADVAERDFALEAVITVPHYFGVLERQETRLAGYAAGLDVIGIINEPTAAALVYGLLTPKPQRVLVFDLGGGTFDVTLLAVNGGRADVVASAGSKELGGKDWDEKIDDYLRHVFHERTGREVPDDARTAFEVRSRALAAKLALTERESTTVDLAIGGEHVTTTLHRAQSDDVFLDMAGDEFYFAERSSDLVQRVSELCSQVVRSCTVPIAGGGQRPMTWRDIDEVVLSGGSSRMPMIPAMLRTLTEKPIRSGIEGMSFDTAVALGAALYAERHERVRDVLSHGIGVEVVRGGRSYVDPLIAKDTPLPCRGTRRYVGGRGAVLRVYEGEPPSSGAPPKPDELNLLGTVELETDNCDVDVHFDADPTGTLLITAQWPPDHRKALQLRHDLFEYGRRAEALRERVQSVIVEP